MVEHEKNMYTFFIISYDFSKFYWGFYKIHWPKPRPSFGLGPGFCIHYRTEFSVILGKVHPACIDIYLPLRLTFLESLAMIAIQTSLKGKYTGTTHILDDLICVSIQFIYVWVDYSAVYFEGNLFDFKAQTYFNRLASNQMIVLSYQRPDRYHILPFCKNYDNLS